MLSLKSKILHKIDGKGSWKMNEYNDLEFQCLINPIIENIEYQKIKEITHHGISRYDHCMRVAYFSYKITKLLQLDYKETAKAAMLHDFFTDEVEKEKSLKKLRRHPNYAVENAKKHFELSEKQVDIIKTHMFPITFTPPKYLESWIVDLVDDFAAIYEKGSIVRVELRAATMFLFLLMANFIKMR